MKGLKKLFTLFLTLLGVVSLSSGVVCEGASREAEEAACELYRMGLFLGTGFNENGQPVFELDRPATRSEAVTMLVRLLGAEEEAKDSALRVPFSDVEAWAKPYVGYAYAKGLASGISGTTFSGGREISATEYLSCVLRALGYQSGSDFQWNAAWELTDRLGITHGEYNHTAPFLRSDIAIVSRNALSTPLKGQTLTLLDTCVRSEGQETGQKELSGPGPQDTFGFEIHFIDVGEVDSALILCDGHAMLVDGGNAADSSLIYSYLRELDVSYLDYIVCTHVHEDHVGGLAGALNYAAVGKAYCSATEYHTRAFSGFIKYLDKQGVSIMVPFPGETFQLGSASVMIIGPISVSDNQNNNSIVLRLQ